MIKINTKKIINILNKIDLKDIVYTNFKLSEYLLKYINYLKNIANIANLKINKSVNVVDFREIEYINNINKNKDYILLGKGVYGSVYKVDEKTCVKIQIIPIDSKFEINRIFNEIQISKICGKKNISPKIIKNKIIYNNFDSKLYFYTYMQLINGVTLLNYLNNTLKNKKLNNMEEKFILKLFNKKRKILHNLGYIHQDLHLGNIMLEIKDKKIIDLYIIDYGLTEELDYFNTINDKLKYFKKQNQIYIVDFLIKNKLIKLDINDNILNKVLNIYNNIDYKNKNLDSINLDFSKNIFNIKLLYESVFDIVNENLAKKVNNEIVNKNLTKKLNNEVKYQEINNLNFTYESSYTKKEYISNNLEYYFVFPEIADNIDNIYILEKNKKLYTFFNYIIKDIGTLDEYLDKNIDLLKFLSKNNFIGLKFEEYYIKKYNDIYFICIYFEGVLQSEKLLSNKDINYNIKENVLFIENYYKKLNKKLFKINLNLESYYYNYIKFSVKNNIIKHIYLIDINIIRSINYFIKNKLDTNFFDNEDTIKNILFIKKLLEDKIIIIK
jgi:tRNA A-37 threonylcarbamoyl transferase component Bud32